ncbi:sensor histidine kinase [Marinirhabdus gelatinilytica]|uniref:histidine kinase n=1 Tax=Marinirhabdus gelatinilytica TaxID=1703343 RepID=A0A370QAT6_9FLAO|nr:HAMP domain-containing sensor histidine kinase [Marinirhabdus gelatinilytica]RDK85399.1 GAF sensor signal transduction histidine kinase [Marinirhabdus gelatinilytica]
MIAPVLPHNEEQRLAALRGYGVLYTEREEEYDQITDLATHITDMPISLISLVEENDVWVKSTQGMDICSTDRSNSFCSYAVENTDDSFVVNNTKNHPKFKNHPFAILEDDPVIFYAGVCLIDKNGYKLGTLCVIDSKPNKISEKQLNGLKKLAKQIVKLIELNKANSVLKGIQLELEKRNNELKNFAGVVSHDMKMPLANIIVTTDILKAKYASKLDQKAVDYLTYLKQSSFTLSDYITGLLNHYESDKLAEGDMESFDIQHLLEEIIELLNINIDCEINLPEENFDLHCNRAALEQIFLNLIGNSLKYSDKDKIVIDIEATQMSDQYFFKVSDNGVGIPKDKQEDIFNLFSVVGNLDRNGQKGSGIGLSTVKKLVNNLGGVISVASEIEKGTTFEFSIKK